MITQDPELSAALGWPGGISNPVLDRTQLLQMVAALRVAAQQVLPTLGYYQLQQIEWDCASEAALAALRAALAQEQAEAVQEPVAWECKAGGLKPLTQRQYDAQPDNIKRHYTRIAPPRRTMVPLTEEEIDSLPWNGSPRQFARAVEKASWEKNHEQA